MKNIYSILNYFYFGKIKIFLTDYLSRNLLFIIKITNLHPHMLIENVQCFVSTTVQVLRIELVAKLTTPSSKKQVFIAGESRFEVRRHTIVNSY